MTFWHEFRKRYEKTPKKPLPEKLAKEILAGHFKTKDAFLKEKRKSEDEESTREINQTFWEMGLAENRLRADNEYRRKNPEPNSPKC